MSTPRSILLPLLLLASVFPFLTAKCIPANQKASLTRKVMKRSVHFGVPSHSLACMAAIIHDVSADPNTDPPCFDEARLATVVTAAIVDCLDDLPRGPIENRQHSPADTDTSTQQSPLTVQVAAGPRRVHRPTSASLPANNGPRTVDAAPRELSDLQRKADEALERIATRNTAAQSNRFRRCVRRHQNGPDGNKAHRVCLRQLGLTIGDTCHCFSGCHFCCILRGLGGGADSCFRDLCSGGFSCN